jgi:putative membrane protein
MLKKYFPAFLLILYLIEFIYFAFNPYDRSVWLAENISVLIPVFLLIITFKKFRFSNFSYFLMAFFLMYHTIGGHFTFERTPFDFFNNFLSSSNLKFLFSENRNNFDRVGHFFVGVFAYPIAEFFYRKKYVTKLWVAILLGILAIGFWGALYEIIEMIYAISEGGEAGQSFLGSQGDIWDAQKDMLLDILGAITILTLFGWRLKKYKKKL